MITDLDAGRIGVRRFLFCRRRNAGTTYGWVHDSLADVLETDIYSCIAENRVAVALGREWLSTGDMPDPPGVPDVEGGVQVRWTRRFGGRLIVHPVRDADDDVFVLVVGPDERYMTIKGAIVGVEAKRHKYWEPNVRCPAYFVPQGDLETVEEALARRDRGAYGLAGMGTLHRGRAGRR